MEKAALVTGAGRGLGLEFTRQLLNNGYTVFACARNPGRSEGLAALAEEHGDALIPTTLDVGDAASIEAAYDVVSARFDRLNVLVNNAGINSRAGHLTDAQRNVSFGSLEESGILEMVRINAIAPILIAQRFAGMLEAAQGKIVNISSWLGSIGGKSSGGNYGYCTSKAALNMMGRALAMDLAPRGVTTLMFNPGWVRTDMGGQKAKLTPEESVGGIIKTAAAAGIEQSGTFFQWDGSEYEW